MNSERFEGPSGPCSTQIPNMFSDLVPDLNEYELKVLLYILRRSYGYGLPEVEITVDEIVNGLRSQDGELLNRGAGVPEGELIKAMNGIKEKGLIDVEACPGIPGKDQEVFNQEGGE